MKMDSYKAHILIANKEKLILAKSTKVLFSIFHIWEEILLNN